MTRPSRVRRTAREWVLRARDRTSKVPPRKAPLRSIHAKKRELTKPKLRKHAVPHLSEGSDSDKVQKVKGGKALTDEDVRVLHRPGAP